MAFVGLTEEQIVLEAKKRKGIEVEMDQSSDSNKADDVNPFHGVEVTADNDIISTNENSNKHASILKMQELTQASPDLCEKFLQKNEYDYEKSITDYYASLSLR